MAPAASAVRVDDCTKIARVGHPSHTTRRASAFFTPYRSQNIVHVCIRPHGGDSNHLWWLCVLGSLASRFAPVGFDYYHAFSTGGGGGDAWPNAALVSPMAIYFVNGGTYAQCLDYCVTASMRPSACSNCKGRIDVYQHA